MEFQLHPRLAADTLAVVDLPLSTVLLMDDSRFPWLILVPRRPGLRELHDLPDADRSALMDEIVRASRALESLAAPEKINVGALGNVVSQLHVHVVARNGGDAAWPGPVWGAGTRIPYEPAAAAERRDRLRALLRA